jgi:hypothetical protein
MAVVILTVLAGRGVCFANTTAKVSEALPLSAEFGALFDGGSYVQDQNKPEQPKSTPTPDSQTTDTANKIHIAVTTSKTVLKAEYEKLDTVTIHDPTASDPNGLFYDAKSAKEALIKTRESVLNSLADNKLVGLRAYAMEALPSPGQLRAIHKDNRDLVDAQQAYRLFNDAENVIDTIEKNDTEIEFTIATAPGDATFELRTHPEGRDLLDSYCTNECSAKEARGIFDYKILKKGFKTKLFSLRTMGLPPTFKLDCKLVPEESKDDPQPCAVIRSQQGAQ